MRAKNAYAHAPLTMSNAVDDIRNKVHLGANGISHANGIYAATAFDGIHVDNSFNMQSFVNEFTCEVEKETHEAVTFHMTGVDAPIANALRRIMIAEVPTMAFEDINLYQNTCVLPDEVLVHRLGLIPLQADPRNFQDMSDTYTGDNTLLFILSVKANSEGRTPVYARDLKWVPQAGQEDWNPEDVGPIHPDVLITQLGPGQEIEAELFCSKGVGREHAKWSPVSTASYKLMPEISFTSPITGDSAQTLVDVCPMNVFDIEDGQAIVKNVEKCTMCRECIRSPEFEEVIKLRRLRSHFICMTFPP